MSIVCKDCGGVIRITKEGGLFGVSCGSLDCLKKDGTLTFHPTLKNAALQAEVIYGKEITELTWEGKKIKSKGEWLI